MQRTVVGLRSLILESSTGGAVAKQCYTQWARCSFTNQALMADVLILVLYVDWLDLRVGGDAGAVLLERRRYDEE